MKHTLILLVIWLVLISTGSFAQSWDIGGNIVKQVSSDVFLGILSPNTKNLVFVNGSSVGTPLERGRITSGGLWGIGTQAPNSRFHINAPAGQTPFRVQVNSNTKLYVNSNGGVSVGSALTPPENGLLVGGNIRIGSGTFAEDVRLQVVNGNDVTPSSGGYFVAGPLDGINLAIDDNEIMARDNGQPSNLVLNAFGGGVNFSQYRLTMPTGVNRVGMGTGSPESDLHLVHELGSGANNGLRIENAGPNNEYWNFYTQDNSGNLTLYENGNLRGSFNDVSGIYTSLSDARYKKNIENAGNVLERLLQLDVKKYHFTTNAESDKKYYGLLAQEVEKYFPEVVYVNKTDDGKEIYSMDYSAFGVLAVKAIQEQQQQTEVQQKNIDVLSKLIERLVAEKKPCPDNNSVESNSQPSPVVADGKYHTSDIITLEQNMPNPFNHSTAIRYKVPSGASAFIRIYSNNGTMIKQINAKASGTVTINAGELAAGTYMYTLIVNGKQYGSRKMVLVK